VDKARLLEALMKVLGDDEAASGILDTSRAVNEEIEASDLMRRTRGDMKTSAGYNQVNLREGDERIVATDKFVAGVAAHFIASEAWQETQRTIAELQKKVAQLPEMQRDNALLRARLTELERDEDERLAEKISTRRENSITYIDLPENSFVSQAQNRAVVSTNSAGFEETQAVAQLHSFVQKLQADLAKKGGR